MDWVLNFLTTYIHHSKLHFTNHWHTYTHTHTQTFVLSLLKSPLAFSWQQLLTVEILHLPWSSLCPLVKAPHLNSQLNCSASFQQSSSAQSTQKTQILSCCRGLFTAPLHSNGHGADHIGNTILLLLRACMLRSLRSNGRCLQSHCLTAGLYATILRILTCCSYLIKCCRKFCL
jgi:hypothetical protein